MLRRASHLLFCITAGGSGMALLAQGTQTASVNGQVLGVDAKAISGASVMLSSPALQFTRTAITDEEGRFIARLLPPGTYTIEISKAGFSTTRVTQVLGVDQTFSPRVVLAAQQVVEVVVTGDLPEVDRTEVKSATNYNLDNVLTLPSGRTPEALGLLTPGVTSGVGGRPQVRGAMTSSNLYLLDGQNINDNTFASRGVSFIDDTIEEVQVITGALPAEYGEVDGGVFNAVTRSGGNDFSGTLRLNVSNDAKDAVTPMQDRASIQDKWNKDLQATVGGYIVKDKLWFFVGGFSRNDDSSRSISSFAVPGPGAQGAGYTLSTKDRRVQAKLTWAVNENNTLVASYMHTEVNQDNVDAYNPGELRALVKQDSLNSFLNLSWRSIITKSLFSEVRFGRKTQHLTAGGDPAFGTPMTDAATGLVYNNGLFNAADGGTRRNTFTGNVKFSLFIEGLGSHQLDWGADLLQGTIQARNDQSPVSQRVFNLSGIDVTARQATVSASSSFLRVYQTSDETATETSLGFYVNDKWTLNNHLTFQVGGRLDAYSASSDSRSDIAKASAFSPRLGVKYDLLGDGRWVLGGALSRYTSKVLPVLLNRVTNAGNTSSADYLYAGTTGTQTFAVLGDRANWQATPFRANVPTLTNAVNPHLKAPTVDEAQLSVARSFRGKAGEGFLRVTFVHKEWKNLIDYRVGNDGTMVVPGTSTPQYLRVWDNTSDAKRKYQGMELDGQYRHAGLEVSGNTTWASLKGNYQGEGSSTPGSGEGLNDFRIQNGNVMYDVNDFHPYGYLAGHQAIRSRWTLSYGMDNKLGRTSAGFIYRYDSGAHFSYTRVVPRSVVNGTLDAQAPTTFNQYENQQRGEGIFPSTWVLDFALTQDLKLFTVKKTQVASFVKLTVGNVLNHQQQGSYVTTFKSLTSGANLSDPFIPTASYGQATSASNYLSARNLSLSVGFKF
jgi:hypothetical protein